MAKPFVFRTAVRCCAVALVVFLAACEAKPGQDVAALPCHACTGRLRCAGGCGCKPGK